MPGTQPEQLLTRARHQVTELEAIFAAHADGLVIYGPDGEIRSMNPAAREMFGASDGSEGEYAELMKALAPLDADGDPLPLDELPSRRAMRGELVHGFVMAVHTAKGLVWYSASAAPLWTADGAIAGAVVSCVDVTHLRRLKEEREKLVRALTHDARTRLNVIQTHGELLGRAAVDAEDARRRGGIIVSSTRRLAGIIDALVDGS
jgi:PAS domain S-box-containing protein